MTTSRTLRTVATLAAAATALAACSNGAAQDTGASGTSADYPSEAIGIMAPGSAGGGWDATARAMERALTEGGIVDESVSVYNVPGAGGTIGLAEFVSENEGNPHEFMWMAPTMVGAIHLNDSPVTLEQVTPIARTHTGYRGIVVDAESEYETFEELAEAWVADPKAFSFAGGSAGGSDHLMIGSLAQELGIDPNDLNYVPTAGGGELNTSILSGAVSAGATGLEELVGQVEAGEMRLLAVSTAESTLGAPTFEDLGYEDVITSSWFGVVAPGGLSDEERDAAVALVEEMLATDQWAETLKANNYDEYVLVGEDFTDFLKEEDARAQELLASLGLL